MSRAPWFVVVSLVLVVVAAWLGWQSIVDQVESPGARDEAALASPRAAGEVAAAGANEAAERHSLELCGYGVYEPVTDDASHYPPEIAAAAELSLQRLSARLLASAKDRDQALGLFLGAVVPAVGDGCKASGSVCRKEQERQQQVLAELARESRDPAVYALAQSSCRMNSGLSLPNCAALKPADWAERDPKNASAWFAAGAASKDPNERRFAVLSAARADRFERYESLVYALAAESELKALGAPVRTLVMVYLEGSLLGFAEAASAAMDCSKPGADRDLLAACGTLAERLVAEPSNLLDATYGAKIGARLGWSESRLTALRRERDQLQNTLLAAPGSAAPLGLGCEVKEHMERRAAARQRMGEFEYARALLASGTLPPLPSPLAPPFGPATAVR